MSREVLLENSFGIFQCWSNDSQSLQAALIRNERKKTKEAMLTVEGYSEQICSCLTLTISLGYRWRRESIRGKELGVLRLTNFIGRGTNFSKRRQSSDKVENFVSTSKIKYFKGWLMSLISRFCAEADFLNFALTTWNALSIFSSSEIPRKTPKDIFSWFFSPREQS